MDIQKALQIISTLITDAIGWGIFKHDDHAQAATDSLDHLQQQLAAKDQLIQQLQMRIAELEKKPSTANT